MTWLGLVLGGIGVVDLVRAETMRRDLRSAVACLLPGALALGLLWLAGVPAWVVVGTVAGTIAAAVSWSAVVTGSLAGRRPPWFALAVGAFIVAGALVLSPYSPELGGELGRWYSALPLDAVEGVPLDRFVLVAGCSLFLISSGNVIVRLVLMAAGSSIARSEQQIKGGRVLGPMERLVIFGLGVAGNLAAASIIVAAKGLLRFPELQAYRADVGADGETGAQGERIDALTEYFLIGSLASWLLALAPLALT